MLGHKWILFVGGILLANAIDSSHKQKQLNVAIADAETQSFTNKKLGLTIENLKFNANSSPRQSRNLMPPYQEFSQTDSIQYYDSKSRNNKNLPGIFGSFRVDSPKYPTSSPTPFRRRSDDGVLGTFPASQMSLDLNLENSKLNDYDYMNEDDSNYTLIASSGPVFGEMEKGFNKFQNKVIPINFLVHIPKGKSLDETNDRSEKVRFPEQSSDDTTTARRSGIEFVENNRQNKEMNFNTFVPQSYSEENLHFGEGIPNFQRPFNDDEDNINKGSAVDNENERSAIGNRYYRPYGESNAYRGGPFRDDVTKFGDINGPITASNRPIRDYNDKQQNYQRIPFENSGYYDQTPDNFRPPRHNFPPKSYTEYNDYPPQINSKYYQPSFTWKSRQPRVVFPPAEFPNAGTSNAGTIYTGNDNVVFRDQNFGINDLAAIQDVRNEFSLQDIDESAASKDRGCGISLAKQTAQRRIVGGDDAGFGSFPWQAYIRIGSSRSMLSRCGGSLISRKFVVTAGHCVARATPRQVHVTLGDYVINSAVEPLPAYTFGVRTISVHPYFKFTPQADRFDVAVLQLERPVHYMPHIAPICLPEKNEDFLGKFGYAAGWGALNPGSRLRPKTLQAVDVPVIDNRVCERWHRSNGINVVIYPEMLCAGYRGGGKDSCQGDSGGPLARENEKSGRWYLIGIVSAGYSCASRGQPGIYHRVAHTVDWISHIMNSVT